MAELTVQYGVEYEIALIARWSKNEPTTTLTIWQDSLSIQNSRDEALQVAQVLRKSEIHRNVRVVSRIIGPWVAEMERPKAGEVGR